MLHDRRPGGGSAFVRHLSGGLTNFGRLTAGACGVPAGRISCHDQPATTCTLER